MTDASLPKTEKAEAAPLPPVQDIEWSQAPYIIGSGLCMGSADVVPGVSGGTMAVALGIYRRLLAAISSIDAETIRALLRLQFVTAFNRIHWRFLTALGGGIGVAVAVMVKIVKLPELIEREPTHVYAVFFGLVLASVVVLARRLPRWNGLAALSLVVGTALGFAIVNLVPVSTPDNPLFVFFCGALAICAMILPGISGSFILLILGKYEYVLGALGNLTSGGLWIVIPFALGAGLGILTFSRVLGWMLDRWHDPMVAGLTGLLVGSLWRIWPFQVLGRMAVKDRHGEIKMKVISAEPYWPESFSLSVLALLVAGFAAVLVIEQVAMRRQRGEAS